MADWLTMAGFFALVGGVSYLSPPCGAIVAGLLMLCAGLFARFRRPERAA